MSGSIPTFWVKIVLIGALVALADWLLFEESGLGLGLGLVLLSWAAALALANRAVWRHRLCLSALVAAAAFAALQIERPSAVACLLFALALGVAALSPRAGLREGVWRWGQRLVVAGLKALFGPFLDLHRLRRARNRRGRVKVASALLAAVLPVTGGLVFLSLFAAANPVIADTLSGLRIAPFDAGRLMFWAVIALPVSAALRPRGLRRFLPLPERTAEIAIPGVTTGSIVASLVVFNALFALQNALDLRFLWADARLPGTLTFAQYAHRGAYPLIATAILAGLFVVVFLRPGSPTAASKTVRALVVLWVAQNLFLVASAALRLLDYIGAYDLTRVRIAALMWMALVAMGLGLILWRLIAGKTGSWLINANALVLGVVLAACSVVDLGSIAANWNVTHRPAAGPDLEYLVSLRGAAVVPLAELEREVNDPGLRTRVALVRCEILDGVTANQSGWRSWRWRDARRLERVRSLMGAGYACQPHRFAAPLTSQPNPRT